MPPLAGGGGGGRGRLWLFCRFSAVKGSTSWVRGVKVGGGGGWVRRKILSGSGLLAYCNLCKCGALLITADLLALCSGDTTAAINWQPSAILVLDALVNRDGQRWPAKSYGAACRSSVWWYTLRPLHQARRFFSFCFLANMRFINPPVSECTFLMPVWCVCYFYLVFQRHSGIIYDRVAPIFCKMNFSVSETTWRHN